MLDSECVLRKIKAAEHLQNTTVKTPRSKHDH
jgi:hypothetical protein